MKISIVGWSPNRDCDTMGHIVQHVCEPLYETIQTYVDTKGLSRGFHAQTEDRDAQKMKISVVRWNFNGQLVTPHGM